MSFNTFLTGALQLFSDTLELILSQSALAFFAGVPLVLLVIALFGTVARGARK